HLARGPFPPLSFGHESVPPPRPLPPLREPGLAARQLALVARRPRRQRHHEGEQTALEMGQGTQRALAHSPARTRELHARGAWPSRLCDPTHHFRALARSLLFRPALR